MKRNNILLTFWLQSDIKTEKEEVNNLINNIEIDVSAIENKIKEYNLDINEERLLFLVIDNHHYVRENGRDLVKLLLNMGADPAKGYGDNYDIFPPIHLLSIWYTSEDKEIFDLMIEKIKNIDAKDDQGRTPLVFSVIHGNIESSKILIEKGNADVFAKSNYLDKNNEPIGIENIKIIGISNPELQDKYKKKYKEFAQYIKNLQDKKTE